MDVEVQAHLCERLLNKVLTARAVDAMYRALAMVKAERTTGLEWRLIDMVAIPTISGEESGQTYTVPAALALPGADLQDVTNNKQAPAETVELHRQVRAVFASLVQLLCMQSAITIGDVYKPERWTGEFRRRVRATKSFFMKVELSNQRMWQTKPRTKIFNWDL